MYDKDFKGKKAEPWCQKYWKKIKDPMFNPDVETCFDGGLIDLELGKKCEHCISSVIDDEYGIRARKSGAFGRNQPTLHAFTKGGGGKDTFLYPKPAFTIMGESNGRG